jgi:phosphoribosylglycinamide formyltransferase-1
MGRRTKPTKPPKPIGRALAPPATRAQRRARVARIASALPEARVEGQQHLSCTVRGKRFAWILDDHHGDGRSALHCKAGPGTQGALVEAHPERFHVPPYLGSKGWVGLWLDRSTLAWDEVAELLREAYRLVAPARLRAALEEARATGKPGRRRSAD